MIQTGALRDNERSVWVIIMRPEQTEGQQEKRETKTATSLTYEGCITQKELVGETLGTIRQKGIFIAGFKEVSDYLLSHFELNTMLPRIVDLVLEQFEDNSQLSLEKYSDPEVEDQYLTLYIRQKKYENKIVNQIEDISRKIDLSEMTGWILITTDFRSPL